MFKPIKLKQKEVPEDVREIHDQGIQWESLRDSEAVRALADNPDCWIEVKEFAKRAGVKTSTVYQWIGRGKLDFDENENGRIVVNPANLIDVPRPTAYAEERHHMWTGYISESGREYLRNHALGGSESYTVELGLRFLLMLLGEIEPREGLGELEKYLKRHDQIRDTFRNNLMALARVVGKE